MQIFLPSIFESLTSQGVVVKCDVKDGSPVDLDTVLLEVRSSQVQGTVQSPVAGEVVAVYVAEGDILSPGALLMDVQPATTSERQPNDGLRILAARRAHLAMGAALAVPALALPLLWTLILALLALILVGSKDEGLAFPRTPSDVPRFLLVSLRGGLSALLQWALALAPVARAFGVIALCAVAGPLIAGSIGAIKWTLTDGGLGAGAAARLAAYDYGLALAGFLLSYLLARPLVAIGQGDRELATRAGHMSRQALLVAVGLLACWAALWTLLIPTRTWWPGTGFTPMVSGLPHGVSAWLLERQASWVEAQTYATASCLAARDRGHWDRPQSARMPDGGLAIFIRATGGKSNSERSLAALALALQNELSPYRAALSIDLRKGRPLLLTTVPTTQPMTNVASLGPSLREGSRDLAPLERKARAEDTESILSCTSLWREADTLRELRWDPYVR